MVERAEALIDGERRLWPKMPSEFVISQAGSDQGFRKDLLRISHKRLNLGRRKLPVDSGVEEQQQFNQLFRG